MLQWIRQSDTHACRRPRHLILIFGAVFFDDDMSVRPRDPKAVHTYTAHLTVNGRELHHGGCHLQRMSLPVKAGIWVFKMQMLRDCAVAQHQSCLDQSGNSSGRLEMPHVRLNGANEQRMFRRTSLAVDSCHGIEFNGIAHRRSCTVCFYIPHRRGMKPTSNQCRFHYTFQSGRMRDRQPNTGSTVVHGRAANDSPDAISVSFGITQPLKNDHTTPLSSYISICRRIKRLAFSVRRKHHCIGAKCKDLSIQNCLDPSDNSQIGITVLQVRYCIMHGDQR